MTTVSASPTIAPAHRDVARQVATVITGTVFAGIFGVLQIFLVPRILSVDGFGYWRLFMLYSGYTAIIHMGFADGALLRWAGRPLESFRHEIAGALRFIWIQHFAVVLPACVLAIFVFRGHAELRAVAIGSLLFSVVLNTVTLLNFAAQAARHFVSFAIGNAAPMVGFVILALSVHLIHSLGFGVLIVLYTIAWALVGVYLWLHIRPSWGYAYIWQFGKSMILTGWPVMLANAGLSFAQSADRLVLSSAVPITAFAQYNLAQSAMYVPVAFMGAISRVFFPHLAAVEEDRRAVTYRHASRILVVSWSILLPYYFVLDEFVRRILPKYISALSVAPLLLLAVLFFGLVQVLHSSLYNVCSRQREFLISSLCAVLAAFGLAATAAFGLHSLRLVAVCQIVVGMLWWICNEFRLRKMTGATIRDWLQVFVIFAWSAASLLLATHLMSGPLLRIPFYYLLAAVPLAFVFSSEFKYVSSALSRRRAEVASAP